MSTECVSPFESEQRAHGILGVGGLPENDTVSDHHGVSGEDDRAIASGDLRFCACEPEHHRSGLFTFELRLVHVWRFH